MKFGQAYLLLLSAIFVAAPAVADQANGGCVVEPGAALAERGTVAGLLALARAPSDKPFRLSFDCLDGRVSSLQVRSIPGQMVEARFLLARQPGVVADLEWDATATGTGWSRLESEPADEGSTEVTLRIDVPASAVPGTVQSGQLQFRSDESGQTDSFSLKIPLLIEIVDSEPLFRNDFHKAPDPNIGQFSMVY